MFLNFGPCGFREHCALTPVSLGSSAVLGTSSVETKTWLAVAADFFGVNTFTIAGSRSQMFNNWIVIPEYLILNSRTGLSIGWP